MKHGSLFSGIGGFDLAAEWMGWENIFHCEWNPFGQKVLKHYWPQSISYNDITKTDFTIHRGQIDILTGGFPCQPYSMAGKRKGKDDERHLWPEMRRAIREIQPRWIVGENVLGLVNWSGGLVFEEVQADLEAEGYEVWAYVLPAAAVNAPHRRDRVWFVAHATGNGYDAKPTTTNNIIGQDNIESGTQWKRTAKGFGNERAAADTDNCFNKTLGQRSVLEEQKGQGQTRRLSNGSSQPGWLQFPTQSPVCTGDDGLPPRLDGITFPKWRNESIKAAGNAIVPQVVLQIFKSIEQYDTTTKKATN